MFPPVAVPRADGVRPGADASPAARVAARLAIGRAPARAGLMHRAGRGGRRTSSVTSAPSAAEIAARLDAARAAFAEFDLVVAPSAALAREFAALGFPTAPRCAVSDYGFPIRRAPPSSRRAPGRCASASSGTLVWHKGVHVLIEAVGRAPAGRVETLIFGDPDVSRTTPPSCAAWRPGLPVRFMGRFDRDDAAARLRPDRRAGRAVALARELAARDPRGLHGRRAGGRRAHRRHRRSRRGRRQRRSWYDPGSPDGPRAGARDARRRSSAPRRDGARSCPRSSPSTRTRAEWEAIYARSHPARLADAGVVSATRGLDRDPDAKRRRPAPALFDAIASQRTDFRTGGGRRRLGIDRWHAGLSARRGSTQSDRRSTRARSITARRATSRCRTTRGDARRAAWCRTPCRSTIGWLAALVDPLRRDAEARRHLRAAGARRRRLAPHAPLPRALGRRGPGPARRLRALATLNSRRCRRSSASSDRVVDNVCAAIRRSVWTAIPFRSTPIAEDVEWGREVLLAGHGLAYVPDAVVEHSHDRSAWLRAETHLGAASAAASAVRPAHDADGRCALARAVGGSADAAPARALEGARAVHGVSARRRPGGRLARSDSISADGLPPRGASTGGRGASDCAS